MGASLLDAYYDYRWRQVLEPLYQKFQQWKAGELDHMDMDEAIHETHKQTQEVYIFFTQKRNLLVRVIQLDDAWFLTWVKDDPPRQVIRWGEMIYPFNDSTRLIADTHFFHENISRYCDHPDGWQEAIIDNLNCLIHPEEIVLHVGDLAQGKKENIESLVPLLNGKLYLMYGNHERRSDCFYQKLGITLVPNPYLMTHPSGLKLVFSHRPILPIEPGVFNLHGHIHNNPAPELGSR